MIYHKFLISEYVLEKMLVAFDFDENLHKVLHKITMCQKTFWACTLQLIKCFQFQDMIGKTEEGSVSKNIDFVYFANFLFSPL